MDAKELFFSDEVQKSWRIHAYAFQPLLEDVFSEDFAARITLTAALNHISNRNLEIGLQKLDTIEDCCASDADRAAMAFFRGVAYDMQGDDCVLYAGVLTVRSVVSAVSQGRKARTCKR